MAAEPGTTRVSRRTDNLEWDEYFMGIALLSAQRSKDPNTQVGACLVNKEKRIVGVGYNGFPRGCSDDTLPWDREGTYLETKYPYVVHAEVNAVLNSIQRDLSGCSIYVALFPCNECAKVLIQAGVAEVVYLSDKYADSDQVKASKTLFAQSGVACRRLEPRCHALTIDFDAARV
jgi:dCMP deaminase